ncbi:MAG: hypothetical protein WCK90_04835 [archaeon]
MSSTLEPDFSFNPLDFVCQVSYPIDNSFWIHLADDSLTKQGFYHPSQPAKKDWPDLLKVKYGIEEYIFYDPEIVGLPLQITNEMLEAKRKDWNKYIVEDFKSMKPLAPPEKITPEEWLMDEQMSLYAETAFDGLIDPDGTNPPKERKYTDFEKKVMHWRKGYGFLVNYKDMKGILFPTPRDDEALKFEIVREYFFNIPGCGVVLSLAQEPNTDRAIWGMRRDFATDWPKEFSKQFIERMNYISVNLENILSTE